MQAQAATYQSESLLFANLAQLAVIVVVAQPRECRFTSLGATRRCF
jgi:hypothetical protein